MLASGDALAQDAHYWTYQFGTRANLLSGAVVGSVVDLGAAFYNPGALTLIEEPDIISTQKVFELSDITYDPDVGVDVSLNHLRLDVAPGYVAGILPFRFLRNHVLAYSLFTRYLFKAQLSGAAVGRLEDLDETLSGDFFTEADVIRELNESWGGLSWSFPLGAKVGFGVSLFGAYRSQKGSNRVQVQILEDLAGLAFSQNQSAYSYWQFRVLAKAGVTFDWLGNSLGMTVTTPGLGLLGDGRVLFNNTLAALDTVFVADYQEGLSPDYQSPLSIALGSARRWGATTLHVTGEWFARVDEYNVLDPQDFVGQTTGDTISLRLTQALDPVVNFAVGLQHDFQSQLTGYLSFRTDYSARKPEQSSDISAATWNIYYVTAGGAFRIGTADLTLGLAFGWGERSGNDVVETLPGDDPVDPPTRADVSYRSLRAIITFAI
jgi:hypothetical protein